MQQTGDLRGQRASPRPRWSIGGTDRVFLASALLALGLAACHRQDVHVHNDSAQQHVAALLRATPLVDGHNDLMRHYHACGADCPRGIDAYDIGSPVDGQTDLARWRAGGVGAQLLNSGYLEAERDRAGTLKGFAFTRALVARWPDRLAMARDSADVRAAHAAGRIAILLALEDPDRLGTDEVGVRELASAGLRANILAYDGPTALADGHAGPVKHGGLSPLGKSMVGWMQANGVLVDLSHASAQTARDVLDQATAPIIFSHSSAAALCEVSRNVPDDVLRSMLRNGGVVMVSFAPEFTRKDFADWYDEGNAYHAEHVKPHAEDRAMAAALMDAWERAHPKPLVTIGDVADHIEHVRDVAGIGQVGLGSDFDGIDFTPQGLEDVSTFPSLMQELARRGWSDADLRKVAGENFLRVLDAADAATAASARKRGALAQRSP